MSSNRRLFREEAFTRRGQTEPLDGLLRVTAPHEWVILVGLGLALLGVAAWVLFGSVERSAAADCVLARPGERYAVNSEISGNVIDVLVDAGDAVEAGQPIVRISTPELSRHVALARARVSTLEARADTTPDALALARAELLELEALQTSREFITSPYTGEITGHTLAPGQTIAAGSKVAVVRDSAEPGLEAVTLMLPERGRRLDAGMEAQVRTSASNGGAQTLAAEVRDISPRPISPPGWLTELGLPAPERGYLVHLALRDAPAPSAADGDSCSVRIVLRRDSPARLLTSSGSD